MTVDRNLWQRIRRFRVGRPTPQRAARARSWKLLQTALDHVGATARSKSKTEAIPATEAVVRYASAVAELYPETSLERQILSRMIAAGKDMLHDLPAGGDRDRLYQSSKRLVAAVFELRQLERIDA